MAGEPNRRIGAGHRRGDEPRAADAVDERTWPRAPPWCGDRQVRRRRRCRTTTTRATQRRRGRRWSPGAPAASTPDAQRRRCSDHRVSWPSSATAPIRHSSAPRRSRYSTHDERGGPERQAHDAEPRWARPRAGAPSRGAARSRGRRPLHLGADDGEAVEREHEEGAERAGERHPEHGDARDEVGAVEGVQAVLQQPRPGRAEQPERERGEDEPDEPGVGRVELAALEQGADDDVAGEHVEGDGEGDVERDALEPDARAGSRMTSALPRAEAGELGQLGGGDGHAEQADREQVEHLARR